LSFDPAELKKIRFGILQFDLSTDQTKQLKKIAQIAEKKSDLNLDLSVLRASTKKSKSMRYSMQTISTCIPGNPTNPLIYPGKR